MSKLEDILIGGVAGIIGTMALPLVTEFMYKLESEQKKKVEKKLRPEPPFEIMTKKLVSTVNAHPSEEALEKLSLGMHWGYGIGWGALYSVLRKEYPVLSKYAGLPFGVLFYLVGDVLVNTTFKVTAPPQRFPVIAHVRGLLGHIAFAAAAEGITRLLHKQQASLRKQI
jgi:uncharacterized membrane protein YagU involved in acid resistance